MINLRFVFPLFHAPCPVLAERCPEEKSLAVGTQRQQALSWSRLPSGISTQNKGTGRQESLWAQLSSLDASAALQGWVRTVGTTELLPRVQGTGGRGLLEITAGAPPSLFGVSGEERSREGNCVLSCGSVNVVGDKRRKQSWRTEPLLCGLFTKVSITQRRVYASFLRQREPVGRSGRGRVAGSHQ